MCWRGWLDVPYPIPLVLGGLLLGLLPGLPDVELDPDVVLVIFLPPLLYSAASFSDLAALRADARAISMSAIGLVLVTIGVVGVIAHEAIDLPWAMSFALGAIVAPTDPVAATAIMRRLGAPRRIVNLVEGESLANDASALVVYRVAVAAAVGGSFSALEATADFLGAVAGGVAIGLATGWLVAHIRRRVDDPTTGSTISLLTGYAAFLPAEELHVSGVLAAVTAGLYMGWHAPTIVSPEGRLQSGSMWEVLTFLLNAALFILIGLQLPLIVDGLDTYTVGEAIGYSALICATVIGTRFLWLFTMPYLLRLVDRRPQQRERRVGAAAARRRRLVWDARSSLTRRGAGAAAGDGRRRCAARTRPDPVHHLHADLVHSRRPGPDSARPASPARCRRGAVGRGDGGREGPLRGGPSRHRPPGRARLSRSGRTRTRSTGPAGCVSSGSAV